MHKLVLSKDKLIEWRYILRKLIKKGVRRLKPVNNHKRKIYHKNFAFKNIMSRSILKIMQELAPIYEELNTEFQTIDVVDLNFYERWLNERY